jgi:hypothetical protein
MFQDANHEFATDMEIETKKSRLARIRERAEKASEKVAKHALRLVKKTDGYWGDQWRAHTEIEDVQNDFYLLKTDPKNRASDQQFNDLTPKELEELYEVLYGEKMADHE